MAYNLNRSGHRNQRNEPLWRVSCDQNSVCHDQETAPLSPPRSPPRGQYLVVDCIPVADGRPGTECAISIVT